MAEIRCLSDHQDQIRALINVNGEPARNHHWKSKWLHPVFEILKNNAHLHFILCMYCTPCLPQMGFLQAAPMRVSWSCGMRSTGTSWLMSTFCGRSPGPVRSPKYEWLLPNPARCPFSIWPPMERWEKQNVWVIVFWCVVLFSLNHPVCVFCSTSLLLWAAAYTCTAFTPRWWWPTGRLLTTQMSYIPCCYLRGNIRHYQVLLLFCRLMLYVPLITSMNDQYSVFHSFTVSVFYNKVNNVSIL